MKMACCVLRVACCVLRVACCVFVLAAVCGFAESSQPLRASAHVYKGFGGKEFADVLIGDRVALTLRSWAGGLSPAARSERIARRLNQLLAQGMKAENVWLDKPGSEWVIFGFRQPIVTATFEDTWQTSISGTSLAQEWKQGIVAALTPFVAESTTAIKPR
jgi:hypothetical protein